MDDLHTHRFKQLLVRITDVERDISRGGLQLDGQKAEALYSLWNTLEATMARRGYLREQHSALSAERELSVHNGLKNVSDPIVLAVKEEEPEPFLPPLTIDDEFQGYKTRNEFKMPK